MDKVILKQVVSIRPKIAFGLPVVLLAVLISREDILVSILLFLLAAVIFTISQNLIITKKFNNYYRYYTLGLPVFKIKKSLLFPEYISLFNQGFIQTNHEGFSPNNLVDTKYKMYTIKFFKDNRNDMVFQSRKKDLVVGLGKDLCGMLNVELYNTLE
ncbi:hypothetical protein RM697_05220 [Ichthyenterobacterium sp. W332]|uniref:DUF304 domain-containing protein n=1 Tax=Microcosmobacter mediterraneus TaxID=3075607 RepID=A0ABU2YIM9_9FLAO|nr:hypothetical protein [Ichthyenterobacterium sp. W332]MDT0558033.1 hypothetical protein [Ichthyenterobacterium sp. W332]